MKKIVLMVMASLMIATAASAEDMKFYVGAHLYQSAWMYDSLDYWYNNLFIGAKSDNLRFELYPRLRYNTSESESSGSKTESKNTAFGLGGNVYYDFAKSGFIIPFVGAGASFGIYSREDKTGGVKTYDRKGNGYTLDVQGGVSLSIAQSWSLDAGLELSYYGDSQKNKISDVKTTSKGYGVNHVLKIRYTF